LKKLHETLDAVEKKDFNSILRDYAVPFILLVILIIITSLIVYTRIKIQINAGPFWDTFAYLGNAMDYAGMGTGYYEYDRPPLIPFLTAIAFNLGFFSEIAIFVVDGLIFIFGVIGLYLLFKLRFNSIQSFTGSLLFVSFPLVLAWLGLGYVDLASLMFSIWAIFFLVMALKKNPAWFYLAIPFGALAVLTRFSAFLILFPLVFYIAINKNYLKNLKFIFRGVLIGLILFIPFLIFIYLKVGDPFYSFQWAFGFTSLSPTDYMNYSTDPFYYLYYLKLYLSSKGFFNYSYYYMFIALIFIGISVLVYDIIKTYLNKFKLKKKVRNALKVSTKISQLKLILFFIFALAFLVSYTRVSYLTSEFLFLLLCISLYVLIAELNIKKIDMDLLFLSWFGTSFIFVSLFALRFDRYFLMVLPAVAYFIILGLDKISEKLKFEIKDINITSLFLSVIFIISALLSTGIYLNDLNNPQSDEFFVKDIVITTNLTNDVKLTANWLKSYDPNYKSKKIRSDYWPAFAWYLNADLIEMPSLNQSAEIDHELQKNNVYYYLTLKSNLDLQYYDEIKTIGSIHVFQRNNISNNNTMMLYIGSGWQNYIDRVLGLKANVIYNSKGKYIIGETAYVDGYLLEDLKKYPYVLLYNFKWHDRENTENLLRSYVNSGGTLVIDASGNMDGVTYNLGDSIFLDTHITRQEANPYPTIWISPQLGSNIEFSPFISDDGGIWYGASYESSLLNGTKIENLATLNGNTLIGVQKIGKGKIIWIGYNLVWHAFHFNNSDEKELIQNVLGI
jgi:4-amino-4-deoxy-L-arabinose transferase-like glycosyltransferase